MRKKTVSSLFFLVLIVLTFFSQNVFYAFAMPFYDLQPKDMVLRASFTTFFPLSSEERKQNISLASDKLNNVLVDANKEFSFNKTVGERTEKAGFKNAKIILNGKFSDGIGGGVCQVSTTLYNAVLMADLAVLEYHPHSLSVSYVKPSFDAMVNSYSADLIFLNNTKNPILIKSKTTTDTITIEIYGEKLDYQMEFISETVAEVEPKPTKITVSDNPNDFEEGVSIKQVVFPKNGIISKGIAVKKKGDKIIGKKVFRNDFYKPVQGEIIKSKA